LGRVWSHICCFGFQLCFLVRNWFKLVLRGACAPKNKTQKRLRKTKPYETKDKQSETKPGPKQTPRKTNPMPYQSNPTKHGFRSKGALVFDHAPTFLQAGTGGPRATKATPPSGRRSGATCAQNVAQLSPGFVQRPFASSMVVHPVALKRTHQNNERQTLFKVLTDLSMSSHLESGSTIEQQCATVTCNGLRLPFLQK
jgi:hypothetical protein